MNTMFSVIYSRFLSKITDDMYLELTLEDTVKDIRNILINSLPGFEFPRFEIYNYSISQETVPNAELTEDDFVIKKNEDEGTSVVDKSCFSSRLTSEEIDILAILMMTSWLQRQVTSIENTRMKYSGPDFRMTSQANHLAKLLALQKECHRQSFHSQRLYKRRKLNGSGKYESNWSVFQKSALDGK